MQRIVYRRESCSIEREILPELRLFFRRLRQVRRELGVRPYLNRLQRRRCLANLLTFEEMEREFDAIEYGEDYRELHRRLRRYLYLDSEGLARVLGSEGVEKRSLFLLVS
ncbi:hypothetical protein [Nitratifractor sp.]